MENIRNFNDFISEGIASLKNSALNILSLETPPGSNKGSKVEIMQKAVGIKPGDPWCVAFVYSFFNDANLSSEILNKIPISGGVFNFWKMSKNVKKITHEDALKNPKLILPGMVFCFLSKNEAGQYGGLGHTGIVLSVNAIDKTITSIEGNTNPVDGAREGFGSFVITRKISDPSIGKNPASHPAKMLGFIDFLDGHRNIKDPEYTKFISSIPSIISAYKKSTDVEIGKIRANPKLLDLYGKNYKDRYKK